jgi:predicted transcriptional regulator of viral defense system
MPTRFERRQRLYDLAATQGGYFTAAQARAIGYDRRTLWYHVKTGHFERVNRGFYRLAEFPAQPHEDVIAAWVKEGPNLAIVSHETALTLYELSPIRPRRIHLTVPREQRPHGDRPRFPGVQIHTTKRPLDGAEVVRRFGVRVTSPARTIVDAAEVGAEPSVVIEAADRAILTGLLTAQELRRSAQDRSERVRRLIGRALKEAAAHAPVR